ncbi:MAG: nitroreductase family protein [Janthinobacterium lividum]
MTTANARTSEHDIDPLFLERWSPRAFTGEAVPRAALLAMIEAGGWAASSYNSQPWRFLYALRGTPAWDGFLGLLGESNRAWAQQAGALVVLVSNSLMRVPGAEREVPSHSHSLDAGAASANFALQATRLGWQAHGMVGFDRERAFSELRVPQGYRVEAAYAVGRRGDPAQLPEATRAREAPNGRRPLAEIALEGGFPA